MPEPQDTGHHMNKIKLNLDIAMATEMGQLEYTPPGLL